MKKGKRGKRLLALSGVLLILAGGTAGLNAYNAAQEEKAAQQESEAAQKEDIVAFSIAENALAGFTTFYGGERLSIIREDGTWKVADDSDFPLKQSSIGNMAGALESFVATGTFQSDAAGEYGLDDPACTITVTSELGEEHVLEIGDKNTVTGEYYLRVDKNDTIYTVASTKAKYFLYTKMQLIDSESFPTISSDDITRVTLSDGKALIRMPDGTFTDQDGVKVSTSKSGTYLDTLTALSAVDTLDDHIEGEEAAAYGLDEPTLTVRIDYAIESEATLDAHTQELAAQARRCTMLGRVPGVLDLITVKPAMSQVDETAARIANTWGDTDDGSRTYTLSEPHSLTISIGKQTEGGDFIFTHSRTTRALTLMQETVEEIKACSAADLQSDYVFDMTMSSIASMELSAQGTTKTVEAASVFEQQEDGTYKSATVYRMGGKEMKSSLYSSMYNKLSTLKAQAYLEAPVTVGEASQSGMTVVFTLKNGETHTLTLEPYDGSFYLAGYDGIARKLVSKRDVESAYTAFEALTPTETEANE